MEINDIHDPRIELTTQVLSYVDPDRWIKSEEKENINLNIPVPKSVKEFLDALSKDEKFSDISSEDFKSNLFLSLILKGLALTFMGVESAEKFMKETLTGLSKNGDFQSSLKTLEKLNLNEVSLNEHELQNDI